MKAVVYYEPKDIRIEERPEPVPKNDNMIARVVCCAICGSDLKMWLAGNPRCQPPRIIGHEMTGILTHVGENVQGYKAGERITLATTVGCGQCYYCKNNRSNLCPEARPISNASDGAFAEYIEIPPLAISGGNVVKVPDNVPDEHAALSEPLSCAINCQRLAGIKAGDSVLIIGGGPLGALHAELAKALGAADVMLSGTSEKRLVFLKNLKDVCIINSLEEDVEEIVRKRTNGLGVDAVIVSAPTKEAHEKAIRYVRKGGTISYFASIPEGKSDIVIDSRMIHYREIKIAGASDSRPEHVVEALKLMSEGKIDADSIITHRMGIEKFMEGLELMQARDTLKILIYPGGGAYDIQG